MTGYPAAWQAVYDPPAAAGYPLGTGYPPAYRAVYTGPLTVYAAAYPGQY